MDDIIRMAREAVMPPAEIISDKPVVYPVPDAIERFAALVRADEREACAKVCETHTVDDVLVGVGIAQSCAAAIRARGQQPTPCPDCHGIGYDASGQICACQQNPSFG